MADTTTTAASELNENNSFINFKPKSFKNLFGLN